MNTSQSIRDGEAVVSANESFELGFFSSGDYTRRYLGIWYKQISTKTVVWVANREVPIFDSSGVLKVTNQGVLVVLDRNKTIIWSSNSSRVVQNPVARLLDSGNLVVKDGNDNNPENFLWQSFDYPGDTILPGVKLGMNLVTGLNRYASSWNSSDDPFPGAYTYGFDPSGFPQIILRKGSVEKFRTGPWNGLTFSGAPGLKQNPIYSFHFVLNQEEVYYVYDLLNSSVITRMELSQNGIWQRFLWIDRTQSWVVYLNAEVDNCDTYALCGAHGSCNIENSPVCGCLAGFVPKFPREWAVSDWSNGCVQRTPLDCQTGDGFVEYSGIKLLDTRYSWFNVSMTLAECKMVCLKNCSCKAYANLDIREGGSGCLLWFGDLVDIRLYTERGQDIYIKMATSEIGRIGSNGRKRVGIIAGSVLFTGILLLSFGLAQYFWKRKKQRNKGDDKLHGEHGTESQKEELELPLFDLASVEKATNNFSSNNKLGEGGFGPVYKGMLDNGQEIAVKRLSKNSKQGLDEFKKKVSTSMLIRTFNGRTKGYGMYEQILINFLFLESLH